MTDAIGGSHQTWVRLANRKFDTPPVLVTAPQSSRFVKGRIISCRAIADLLAGTWELAEGVLAGFLTGHDTLMGPRSDMHGNE